LPTNDIGIGLNYHAFSECGTSAQWNTQKNTIGMVYSRFHKISSDGLNHQGANAIVIDAANLAVLQNHGQTSGHSFENSLIMDGAGNFLGQDLGDNYPRGVHLFLFDETASSYRLPKSRVIHNMKTKHMDGPMNSAGKTFPYYPEISSPGHQFWKHSNDNNIYTELGHPGIVDVNDGILAFFAAEKPSLDNSVVGEIMTAPRNVAFVKVPKDFWTQPHTALSPGPVERGGMYSFDGIWQDQVNMGVVWLTSYASLDSSVSRLKTVELADKILLMWEIWTKTSYVRSEYMIVDSNGNILVPVTAMDYPLRLTPQDDLKVVGGRPVALVGDSDGRLVRYEICVLDSCHAGTQTATATSTHTMSTTSTTTTHSDPTSTLTTATATSTHTISTTSTTTTHSDPTSTLTTTTYLGPTYTDTTTHSVTETTTVTSTVTSTMTFSVPATSTDTLTATITSTQTSIVIGHDPDPSRHAATSTSPQATETKEGTIVVNGTFSLNLLHVNVFYNSVPAHDALVLALATLADVQNESVLIDERIPSFLGSALIVSWQATIPSESSAADSLADLSFEALENAILESMLVFNLTGQEYQPQVTAISSRTRSTTDPPDTTSSGTTDPSTTAPLEEGSSGAKTVTSSGEATVLVTDAAAFVADPKAEEGVQKAIAKTAQVEETAVSVSLSVVSTRRLQDRKLQEGTAVKVSFTIIAVANSAQEASSKGSELVQTLQAIDTADLEAAIKSEIENIGGNYTVEVADFTPAPEVSIADAEVTQVTTSSLDDETSSAHLMEFWKLHVPVCAILSQLC